MTEFINHKKHSWLRHPETGSASGWALIAPLRAAADHLMGTVMAWIPPILEMPATHMIDIEDVRAAMEREATSPFAIVRILGQTFYATAMLELLRDMPRAPTVLSAGLFGITPGHWPPHAAGAMSLFMRCNEHIAFLAPVVFREYTLAECEKGDSE